jgi:hypothetical protein
MAKAMVSAGACGYSAVIEIRKLQGRRLAVEMSSECTMLQAMAKELRELDWGGGVLQSFATSKVYRAAEKYVRHASCPIPCAVLKTIEVEIGIALPNKVEIEIEGKPTLGLHR